MLYRTIRHRDWEAICAIQAAVYPPHLVESQDALMAKQVWSPETCHVVEYAGRIAGYVLAIPSDAPPGLNTTDTNPDASTTLHLHDLAVAPGYRKIGMGRFLFMECEARARLLGFRQVSLICVAGSLPFWTHLGLTPKGEPEAGLGYGSEAVLLGASIPVG